MVFEITEYEYLRRICMRATGDVTGLAIWTFREAVNSHTQITIDWDVTTMKVWMNCLGLLLRPLFIYNHGGIMRSGERGLNAYLASSRPATAAGIRKQSF
jgi:hypothetical protein